MKINQCPKFHTCNACICPLDKDWRKRTNHREDPTCFYMIESVKNQAQTNFEGAQQGELYLSIILARDSIRNHFKRIDAKLKNAANTSSRICKKFNAKGNV